jgi:hypothetical protein
MNASLSALSIPGNPSPTTIALSLIAAPTIYFAARHAYYKLFVRKGKKLPSPPRHWLWGHTVMVGKVISEG